jgi:hypothetical protein
MRLKVFEVVESQYVEDGREFYAAASAEQACELYLKDNSRRRPDDWTGGAREIVGAYYDGEPGKLNTEL